MFKDAEDMWDNMGLVDGDTVETVENKFVVYRKGMTFNEFLAIQAQHLNEVLEKETYA